MGLCLALGGMTFKEMLGRMKSDEVSLWLAFANRNGPVNPLDRADLRSAIVASVVANSAPRGRNSKTFTHADFIPRWRAKEASIMTPDEQFEAMKVMLNAKPAKKKKK